MITTACSYSLVWRFPAISPAGPTMATRRHAFMKCVWQFKDSKHALADEWQLIEATVEIPHHSSDFVWLKWWLNCGDLFLASHIRHLCTRLSFVLLVTLYLQSLFNIQNGWSVSFIQHWISWNFLNKSVRQNEQLYQQRGYTNYFFLSGGSIH